MKIYNLDNEKSKIRWSSQIGEQKIKGEMNTHDGKLISELGKVIEGNVSIDLRSMRVTDNSLSKEERKKIEDELKSFPLLKNDESLANYKIEKIIPQENNSRVKGLLMISNQAFGIDVITNFEQSEDILRATGKVAVENSNPVLLQELDHLYDSQLHDEKSIKSFELECELFATAN